MYTWYFPSSKYFDYILLFFLFFFFFFLGGGGGGGVRITLIMIIIWYGNDMEHAVNVILVHILSPGIFPTASGLSTATMQLWLNLTNWQFHDFIIKLR